MSADNSDLDYTLKLYRDSFYLRSHEGFGTYGKTPVRKQQLKAVAEKYIVCNLYEGTLHLKHLRSVTQIILKVISNSHLFLSLSFFQLLQRVLANELQHHFLKKIIIQNLIVLCVGKKHFEEFKDTPYFVCRVFYLSFLTQCNFDS